MMKVEVLGIGCAKGKGLLQNGKTAVHDPGVPIKIVKVEEIAEIAGKGVLNLPAMIMNDRIMVTGRVAPVEKLMRTPMAGSE